MEEFSEIQYARPDGQAFLAVICHAANALKESVGYGEAKEVFDKVKKEGNHFQTMQVVASIRSIRWMSFRRKRWSISMEFSRK